MKLSGALLLMVLLAGMQAGAGLLVREEFNTDSSHPDYTNGIYRSGRDLVDTNGNATCSGGSIVGFDESSAWKIPSTQSNGNYFDAYDGFMRIVKRTYGAVYVGRETSIDLNGKTQAYAMVRLKILSGGGGSDAANACFAYAGFSDTVSLGSGAGAAVGFSWNGSKWNLVLRYNNGGIAVTTLSEYVAYDSAYRIYWFMDEVENTIKVWVNESNPNAKPDLTVTDWQGTVSGIGYLSAGHAETGDSDVYVYEMLLGDSAEDVGMVPPPDSGLLFVLYGPPLEGLYVAPGAKGSGSGADPANAAAYTDVLFWNRVQSTLAFEPLTVWFAAGEYDAGHVVFENRGSANHRLCLRGTTPVGTVLTAGSELRLRGSRNIEVRHLNFTGNCSGYTVLLESAVTQSYNDCRDITINQCTFKNMPDLYYGAISILGTNAYNITIENCAFDTIGFNQHAHGLYAAHCCHDILVQSNLFRDVSGHCLDFRDRVSGVVVSGNEFLFTDSSYGQENANAIALPNWNQDAVDREIYGNGYTICSNRFIFDTDGDERCAIMFHFSGYSNLCGYTQIPTANDVVTLNSGSPKYKEEFLVGAGIDVPHFEIYGNIYNEHVFRRAEYSWSHYDHVSDTADIYNAFHRARFEDGFEYPDGNPVGWDLIETPGQTDVYTTDSDPAEGARSVRLRDLSASYSVRMDRDVGVPIMRGYYRTWVKINGHSSSVYPFYSTDAGEPAIYWIYGAANGSWRNNNETFSGSWVDNVWYCLEIEFDFDEDEYTVWIDNQKIADGVAIPGDATSLSGKIHIAPATIAEQGDMQMDSVRLGCYE